ncbi:vitamin K epoxide reductase family protein [uncultured Muribaculum sp.]|uniref:vitamin K epoxide reductase family protein n=1 Tax=uncultured Muribaculum sp. TaxID=1918613 RepID=UPI0025F632D8|nr:vitamin K epoxide reductase family protein [uncultured Muribaculum sp.]
MANSASLFTEYLKVLGIPHTDAYSSRRYRAYPRRMAMTAMYDLLREYRANPEIKDGEPSAGALAALSVPFVASCSDVGCRIVTGVTSERVEFIGPNRRKGSILLSDFVAGWDGRALTAAPDAHSGETGFKSHRFKEMSRRVETWVLVACLAFLVVSFAVVNDVFSTWSVPVALVLNAVGIYVCYLLILKDAHVESRAADSVCGVIQSHGCSTVLSHDASVFIGLFPWCQIGMTYFSVSFMAILLYPACVPYLAVASVCCLPYTIWSVCYQKFKIKAWCTLCLCVQTLFWLEFLVYLVGGRFHGVFPLRFDLVILLACYLVTLLVINRIVPRLFGAEMSDADAASAVESNKAGNTASDNKSARKAADTSGIHVTLS